jgi:hypothetical protein
MESGRNPYNLAIDAIEAVMAPGLTRVAFALPPLTQTARARPADHFTNGSTPAGSVCLQPSWLWWITSVRGNDAGEPRIDITLDRRPTRR